MRKIAVIFGGQSTEHEVSIMSANSVINNLDKTKYDIIQIYITKDGIWCKVDSVSSQIMAVKDINGCRRRRTLTGLTKYPM